jgi:branched-chain amino acid transport system substrate-binding protein
MSVVAGRRRSARRALPKLSAAGLTLLVAACGSGGGGGSSSSSSSGSQVANKSPLYIIGPLDLTGTFSHFGKLGLAGLTAEINVINSHGGVLGGHPLVLKYQDDGSDPAKAVLAARELLGEVPKNQILFVEPGSVGVTTTATLPVTTAAGIIDFTLTSIPATDNATTYPFNFASFVTSNQQSQAVVYAMKQLAGSNTKVGVLLGSDAGDQVAAPVIGGQLSAVGLNMANLSSVDPNTTDYTTTLQKMRNAGASVIYVKINTTQSYTNVMNGVQQLGWSDVKILGGTPAANATVLGNIPSSVAKQFYATSLRTYTTQYAPAQLKSFQTELAKQGPIDDLGLSSVYADQVLLAKWAAETAGSNDSAKMRTVLENVSSKPVPSNLLITLPSPMYSASVHNFANTKIGEMWSLLSPGTPINGQWNGQLFSTP